MGSGLSQIKKWPNIFIEIYRISSFKSLAIFMIGCSGCIETYKDMARYNLIDKKHCKMALLSVPTSNLLEPLVKQKWLVTIRGRQPLLFVVMSLNTVSGSWVNLAPNSAMFLGTLDSGVNIGVRLLIFELFSRGYVLIKGGYDA